ncbi:MAG: MBOAT family protein [Clostridia bacterium]|nr:MBOAT family protein [Clostridia bacterium]
MLFNSLQFLIFFPIVTLVYFLIPHKIRYLWLLAASYYFYMCWNPEYALLMATSTFITYLSGIFIERGKTPLARKITVGVSFTLNLAILFYFKYFYFTMDNINAIRELLGMSVLTPRFDVILPVGISFYTFQALSYTMDVYRGELEPEKNPLKYALFVSFFPQLVAGPIERSKNLLTQVSERHYFDYNRVRRGLLMMLWGFFLKLVIADRAAILVNTVYDAAENYSGLMLVLATIAFAVQIYCDFASYSIIARGAARVMGFELMKNFEQPYFSASIAEFWRRWHISLSSWFKDYLYIPLGGNRKGRLRKYINLMTVFLVSGLWHGASWNYVIWGAVHGVYQIAGGVSGNLRRFVCAILNIDRNTTHYKWFQRIFTFVLVCFAWIFFRSESLTQALLIIKRIFTAFEPWSLYGGGITSMGLDGANLVVLVMSLAVLFFVSSGEHKGSSLGDRIETMHIFARWPIYLALIFSVLIFGIYGPGFAASQFIYFQF